MTYEDFIKEAGLARESFRWAWAFCNEVDGPITEPELADELLNLVLVGKRVQLQVLLLIMVKMNHCQVLMGSLIFY